MTLASWIETSRSSRFGSAGRGYTRRMERALLVLLWVVSVTMLTWQEFLQVALVFVPFVMFVLWLRRTRVPADDQIQSRRLNEA